MPVDVMTATFSWTGNRERLLGLVFLGPRRKGIKIALVGSQSAVHRICVGNGGGGFGANSGGAKFLRVGD
jgi:hypothetical protein